LRQRGIFYTFSIGFVTCDSVVFFLLFLLVLQLLQQRGIFIYWFWNCCDSVDIKNNKKYHTVRTVQKPIRKTPQNITPSEQFQNHKQK
jgi:hypothetical protein